MVSLRHDSRWKQMHVYSNDVHPLQIFADLRRRPISVIVPHSDVSLMSTLLKLEFAFFCDVLKFKLIFK